MIKPVGEHFRRRDPAAERLGEQAFGLRAGEADNADPPIARRGRRGDDGVGGWRGVAVHGTRQLRRRLIYICWAMVSRLLTSQ